MRAMKRTLLPIVALAVALAVPATASARVVELGSVATPATPACPADPCEAAVHVTALQGRAAGGPKNPYYIRRDGYIVALTVHLAAPDKTQIDYFNSSFGSPAQLRLSVLRQGTTRKTRLNYRLISQSELIEVDHYFGSTPTFVLKTPLRVKKTNWIAITVPTWAPIFANNLTGADWWRSSRAKDSCDPPKSLRQFSMQTLRNVSIFGCTYHSARVLYTATYVPDPPTTDDQKTS
jgi:hypothetical protein